MVKGQNKDITNRLASKGFEEREVRARKINASTAFETCTEQISPFGGLLGLIKFLDLLKFEEVFNLRLFPDEIGQNQIRLRYFSICC